ncbi:LLM class flavin-dependent oxidoreductase [Paenibacillus eucommiae]|uniref:Luciferase family oxidoreductase group 1 n=1 Tax=Paenibacillus eucommiae TaxID=1355755 RepID=A0ABS4JAR6_9BACL|nr:LLM class flavin-dependent oxidoreductase [Paenibacillus eucommiae]MBP1996325.1 luciferase family oxidoreductase group 1 [Paenibacillus eucommiae]
MSESNIRLSILDIGTVWNGNSPEVTLQYALELSKAADELGYTRYWFAEHHNTPHQTSSSPEMLAALAAAVTERIRLGTGGIMLPNHSPLKVAESFATLETLYPHRIDLGIGRAPGTDGNTALALRRSLRAVQYDDFPDQLAELLSYFSGGFESDHPFSQIKLTPPLPSFPEIYLLGSSDGGMRFATKYGLGLTFAAHIAPDYAVPILQMYHKQFQPSVFMPKSKSIVSIMAIAAETEEEAKYLAGPLELQWMRWNSGVFHLPPPTLEEAASYRYSPQEEAVRRSNKGRFIAGRTDQVADRLRRLAKDTLSEEVMLMQMVPDLDGRIRSMELLAAEFDTLTNIRP